MLSGLKMYLRGRMRSYINCLFGKADFFFCHWYAESENAIIETLSDAGADQYMITMATEVGIPKIDLDKMTMLMGKIK